MRIARSLELNCIPRRLFAAMSTVQESTVDSTFVIVGGGIAGLASVRAEQEQTSLGAQAENT